MLSCTHTKLLDLSLYIPQKEPISTGLVILHKQAFQGGMEGSLVGVTLNLSSFLVISIHSNSEGYVSRAVASQYSHKTFTRFNKKHFQTTFGWVQGCLVTGKLLVYSWILAHYLENVPVWQCVKASLQGLPGWLSWTERQAAFQEEGSDNEGGSVALFEHISPWRCHSLKVFFVTKTNKSFLDFLSRGHVYLPRCDWKGKTTRCIYLLHF